MRIRLFGDSQSMIPPYQTADLRSAFVHDDAYRHELLIEAQKLRSVRLTPFAASCLVMMASGYFSPVNHFMDKRECMNVASAMRMLHPRTMWPVPIMCAVQDTPSSFVGHSKIALSDPDGEGILGILHLDTAETVQAPSMKEMALQIFGTNSDEHPGVKSFLSQPETLLSGRVQALSFSHFPASFGSIFRTASQIRADIARRGWERTVAFQTRNPMHRAHEALCKTAVGEVDANGLIIHMALGKLKEGDIPARTRISAIQAMVSKRMAYGTTVIAGYGFDMLYAGPREAVLHAIMRQNMGCSHFIVGRDHAGVGKHYGPFEAQEMLDKVKDWLEIEICKVDHMCWSKKLGEVVRMSDHPDHGPEDWVFLSGTKVREMLTAGEDLPEEFTRPEVATVLKEYYARRR